MKWTFSIHNKKDKTASWEEKAVPDQFTVGQDNQDGCNIAEKS